jgi:hypothetical protein
MGRDSVEIEPNGPEARARAPTSGDGHLDRYEARLRRRQRHFRRYLRLRAGLGLLLIAFGLAALALAALVAAVALGWVDEPAIRAWTTVGINGILAVFLPLALAILSIRSGWIYWRRRREDDSDTGCLVA